MGILIKCEATLIIASPRRRFRDLRTALSHMPADQEKFFSPATNSGDQSYRRLNGQLVDCSAANFASAVRMGHTYAGHPLCFVPGVGVSYCRTFAPAIADYGRLGGRSHPFVRRM